MVSYSAFSVGLVLFAATLLFAASKILFRGGWWLGFVRGFVGFSCLLLALMSLLVGVNLSSYQALEEGQVGFYVSFKEIAKQQYQVSLLNVDNGNVYDLDMQGDSWQIVIKRLRLLSNTKAYYKADHLQSRYYALEQERMAAQKPISLLSDALGVDIAKWLKSYGQGRWTKNFLRSAFVPVSDGARYAVFVTQDGLEIKAENAAAKEAIEQWL